jgi:hypothetical protein
LGIIVLTLRDSTAFSVTVLNRAVGSMSWKIDSKAAASLLVAA